MIWNSNAIEMHGVQCNPPSDTITGAGPCIT